MNHKSINSKNNYILIFFGLFFCLSNLQASILDHDSLLYIIEQHQDDSIAAQALIDFADDIIDDLPDSAFLVLEDAEEIAANINSTYLLAVIHAKKGLIFEKMNEYADALEQFFQAKNDIESDHDFKQDSASRMIYLQVLNQLGVLYFKIDKFDESIEYLKSVILFMQENGMEPNNETYRKNYVRTYINLGAVNIRQRKFSEAEINYTKAITLLDDSDVISYSVILNNMGIIAKEQEEYDKAFEYHKRSLKMREEEQNYHGMTQSYNNIGATYFVSGDIEAARINFEKSLEISQERNYMPSAIISLFYLRQIQEDRNNYEMAYKYLSQYQAINDSLMNQEKLRAITQLEMQDKFDARVRESQHRPNNGYIMYPGGAPYHVSDIIGDYCTFEIKVNTLIADEPTDGGRAIEGYNIYSGLQSDVLNASSWTPINSTIVADTFYVDETWPPATADYYIYAVEAIYTTGESMFSFSNNIYNVPVSVDELEENDVKVYPNPARNILYIENSTQGTAVIYSITGQFIGEYQLNDQLNGINVSSFSKGLYLIKIAGNNNEVKSLKFFKD